MKKIYLIGSMRNAEVPVIANQLRAEGFEVFDDWHSVGPEADDFWVQYEKARGRNYKEALKGAHAVNVFNFDKRHLDEADLTILVLPAGKSGHMELGYMIGKGKQGYILFNEEPERWDVMYGFATDVFFNLDELIKRIKE